MGDEEGAPAGSPLSVVRVETIVQKTYDRAAGLRKPPVVFKPDREIDSDETWMFTDGSGTGWHGLVVLRRDQHPRLSSAEYLPSQRARPEQVREGAVCGLLRTRLARPAVEGVDCWVRAVGRG